MPDLLLGYRVPIRRHYTLDMSEIQCRYVTQGCDVQTHRTGVECAIMEYNGPTRYYLFQKKGLRSVVIMYTLRKCSFLKGKHSVAVPYMTQLQNVVPVRLHPIPLHFL